MLESINGITDRRILHQMLKTTLLAKHVKHMEVAAVLEVNDPGLGLAVRLQQ